MLERILFMTFYTYHYLESQKNVGSFVKYGIIFALLIISITVFILYMRHRLQTKYRDLTIITFLILLFLLIVQFSDYSQDQANHQHLSRMAFFIQQVAKDNDIDPNDILVNSTRFSDGMILNFNQHFYRVALSNEQNFYQLEETYLIPDKVTIIDQPDTSQ